MANNFLEFFKHLFYPNRNSGGKAPAEISQIIEGESVEINNLKELYLSANAELEHAKEYENTIKEEFDKLKRELHGNQNQLDESKKTIEELTARLDQNKFALQSKANEIEDENAGTEKLIKNSELLNRQFLDTQQRNLALIAEIETYKSLLLIKEDETAEQNSEIATIKEKILALSQEFTNTQQRNEVLKAKIDGLDSTLLTKEKETADQNNEICLLKENISAINRELTITWQQSQTLKTEIDGLNSLLLTNEKEITEQNSEIRFLKEKILALNRELTDTHQRNQALKAEMDGLKSHFLTKEKEITEQNSEIGLLKENVLAFNQEIIDKQRRNQTLIVEIDGLKSLLLTKEKEIVEQNGEIKLLREKVESIGQEFVTAKKKNEDLTEGLTNRIKYLADIFSIINAEEVVQRSGVVEHEVNSFINLKLIPFINDLDFLYNKKETFDMLEFALYQWKNLKRKHWLKNKTIVAFMGKYSSGKSSVINALINEQLLAVDVNETTAVSTYISWGNSLNVKYADLSDNLKAVDTAVFKNFSKKSFKDLNLAAFIKNFIVEYQDETLKKISILDTPGYDSVKKEDKKRAVEDTKESHYIFFMVDINDGGLKEDSLKFITDYLLEKKLYIIVSKSDQKPLQSQKDDTVKKIKQTLARKSIPVENVILFSNKRAEYKKELISTIENLPLIKSNDLFDIILEIILDLRAQITERLLDLKRTINNQQVALRKATGVEETVSRTFISDSKLLLQHINNMTYAMKNQIEDGVFYKIIKRHSDFVDTYNTMIDSYNQFLGSGDKLLQNASPEQIGRLSQQIESNSTECRKLENKLVDIFDIENEFNSINKFQ